MDIGPTEDPQVTPEDDGTLFDRWLGSRDGDAFAELARRHSPVAFDLACRVLGDRAGAEDVLQEALLALALERTRKPVEVGVVAWLARFAICRARNRRASERARSRRQVRVGLERPEGAMPDESLELREELERALAGCDPEDRALLAMRFLHGWDYDRIASALSIREGAARVRVHRALESVRTRAGSRDAARVAPALAALPVAALPETSLDGAIRTAVEIAKVRLGGPPNGVEHATAAARSFRVAVTLTGAALLFVGAAGVTVLPEVSGDGAAPGGSAADLADARPGAGARFLAVAPDAAGPAPVAEAFRGIPRPFDWDHGALRRVATGAGDDGPAGRPAAAEAPVPAAEPVPAVPAREAPAPAAATPAPEDPPSALRPMSRAACAANGEPASPEGERAGALGGSPAVPADEAAPAPADAVEDVVPNRRSRGSAVRADSLPDTTKALLDEAEALVRRFLEEKGAPASAADPDAIRDVVRDVRREFGKLRRGSDAGRAAAGRAKRQRVAVVRQVFALLTESVLAEGRATGEIRWPSGARLDAALAEVIRVLGTQPGPSRLPSGATPPAEPSAPSEDPSRAAPSGASVDG